MNMRAAVTARALLGSKRYNDAMEKLDVMKQAAQPPLDFDSMSSEDHNQIRAWADGRVDAMPKVLADYIEQCS
jgi:hypothetical protein